MVMVLGGRTVYHFKNSMRIASLLLLLTMLMPGFPAESDWPRWRGPDNDGMARGDAPPHWSDTEHIKWKAEIPGRGHSSPVIWGDKVFVTTSVPTGVVPPAAPDSAQPGRGGRGFGSRGPQPEQKLILMCFDRKNGKPLWQQVSKVATPHEGYHPTYGSFAS